MSASTSRRVKSSAIAKAKADYQEAVKANPEDASQLKAKMNETIAQQKKLMKQAEYDQKNCDKEYSKQLTAQVKEKYTKLLAEAEGEVPVGCIIVDGDRIVGRGRNRRENGKCATAHAELRAIENACRRLGGWRLWECELYVTLEPCPMCAGAIVNSRIRRVVYGASDPKAGAAGSVLNLFEYPLNHKPELVAGVLEEECAAELKKFFAELRERRSK